MHLPLERLSPEALEVQEIIARIAVEFGRRAVFRLKAVLKRVVSDMGETHRFIESLLKPCIQILSRDLLHYQPQDHVIQIRVERLGTRLVIERGLADHLDGRLLCRLVCSVSGKIGISRELALRHILFVPQRRAIFWIRRKTALMP